EDPAVAAVMNRLFVNVKVDREERPDLDQIYQSAHQMLAQRPGGWPLTMFLSPDGTPFFGGTYFPKAARFGLPGFPELCERIAAIWRDKQPDIARQNSEVQKALARTLPRRAPRRPELSRDLLRAVLDNLRASFDPRFGGFGAAPRRRPAGRWASCSRPRAATTPRSTPTASTRRASSTSGAATKRNRR